MAKAFVDLHRLSPEHLRDEEQFECLPINGGCAISLPNAPAIGLNRVLGLGAVEDLTLIVFSTTERWIAAAS